MKLVVHISSAMVWRGAEQQVHHLLNADNDEIENYLFCPVGAALIDKNNHLRDRIQTYKKYAGLDLFGGYRLKSFIQKNHIQIAHIHDSHALNLFWASYFWGARIPAIYHKHHNHPIKNKKKYDRDYINKIICVSNYVYETAARSIDKDKLVVIYSGIEKPVAENHTHSLRSEFHFPDDVLLFGTVCALEKEKNLFEVVEIADKIRRTNSLIRFLIVGTGSYENKIRDRILQRGLENIVMLTGFRNDIANILGEFDVFLFTSLSEGFPLSVLEAMLAKLPIVTRDSGGLKEMITDNETGLIYHTPDEAVEKILRLTINNDERKKLADAAFVYAQQFSIDKMIQKTHTLYHQIIP